MSATLVPQPLAPGPGRRQEQGGRELERSFPANVIQRRPPKGVQPQFVSTEKSGGAGGVRANLIDLQLKVMLASQSIGKSPTVRSGQHMDGRKFEGKVFIAGQWLRRQCRASFHFG
jgi:hypothetical protein